MTVEEAQTDLAMVALQKQLSTSDGPLAEASVVIDDVLDLADDVARAQSALTEIKQRVALLPSYQAKFAINPETALQKTADADNPALAARRGGASCSEGDGKCPGRGTGQGSARSTP